MARKTKAERETEALLEQQRRQIVDEFGSLDQELAPQRDKLRRYEELGRIIRGWHARENQATSVASSGDRFEVVLGPCSTQTRILSLPAVYQTIGHERFLAHATVSLSALKAAGVDEVSLAALTIKERTGTRSLVVRPRTSMIAA